MKQIFINFTFFVDVFYVRSIIKYDEINIFKWKLIPLHRFDQFYKTKIKISFISRKCGDKSLLVSLP